MIKGCQKKIIHITNTKSPYFEEAYFILKRGGDFAGVSEDDMVKEALRIANEAVRSVKGGKVSGRRRRAFAVFVGAAAVSLLFGCVMLFYTVT